MMVESVCLKIENLKIKYIFAYRTNYLYFLEMIKFVKYPPTFEFVDGSAEPDVVVGVFHGIDLQKYKTQIKFVIFGEVNQRATGNKSENLYYFSSGDSKIGDGCYRCPVLINFVTPSSIPKTKLVSAIDSGKYQWRVEEIKKYIGALNINSLIDTYGNGLNADEVPFGYHGFPNGKQMVVDNYMFSLCLENTSQMDYFTEKFIDPIITECIPLYKGCKNIKDYFYDDGYIDLSMTDDLKIDVGNYSKFKSGLLKNKNLIFTRYNLLSYFYTIAKNMNLLDKDRPIDINTSG